MLEVLLKAGADPNVRLNRHLWYMEYTFGVLRGSGIDLKGATPFWRAAYAGDVDAIRRHPVYLDTVDAIWRGLKRYLD